MPVSPLRCRRQSGEKAGWDLAKQALDRHGRDVVALIHDYVAVPGQVDAIAANKRLN